MSRDTHINKHGPQSNISTTNRIFLALCCICYIQTVSFLESCVILFKRTHYISIAQYFRKWMCFDIKSRYFFALFTLQLFSLFIKLLVCRMAYVRKFSPWQIETLDLFVAFSMFPFVNNLFAFSTVLNALPDYLQYNLRLWASI